MGNSQKEPGRHILPYFYLPRSLQDIVTPGSGSRTYAALSLNGFLTPWSTCYCSPSAHQTLGGLILWPCWHALQATCCPPVSRSHTPWLSLYARLACQFVFTWERCFLLVQWLWTKYNLWKPVNFHTTQWTKTTSSTKFESQAYNGQPSKFPFFGVLPRSHRLFLRVSLCLYSYSVVIVTNSFFKKIFKFLFEKERERERA